MSEPLRLATLATPGLVGPAARRTFRFSTLPADRVVIGVMVLWPVAVWALTGQVWWLLVPVAVLAPHALRLQRTLAFSRRALGAGGWVAVTWREHDVVIERPTGEVVYDHRALRLHERRGDLAAFRIDLPLHARPLWLLLPDVVVPDDVEGRLARTAPMSTDLHHVGVVPADFGCHLIRDVWLRSRRRVGSVLFVVLMVLDIVALAVLGVWPIAVLVAAALVLGLSGWPRAIRTTLRRRPVGSPVGISLSAAGLVLESAEGRAEAPYTRVRNVDAVGPRHAMIVLRGPQGVVVLPREVLPDAAIDYVRRVIGKPPMLARQRLG